MKPPFIITIEHYNTKVSIEKNHSDVNINELTEMLMTICIAAGYDQDQVNKIFNIK